MKDLVIKEEIKEILDNKIEYRDLLFRRGYLLTSQRIDNNDLKEYPFYNCWKEIELNNYYLYVQQSQTAYYKKNNNREIIIIGHAYNPFNMMYKEEEICDDLLVSYSNDLESYFNKISELTGLHIIVLIDNGKIIACQDACSLTGCYFGKINNEIYITEHPQLVADICGLKMNENVKKLVQTKCYNIGNRHLPGNITPYDELKRLGANTYLHFNNEFSIKRFFPLVNHPEYTKKDDVDRVSKEIGTLIHSGIECCTKKWERCAISLSGGTDSKTTLSCANGLYDKLSFFSFNSKPQELVDANGARTICEKLGLKHTLYNIPTSNEEINDFDLIKKILNHNTNYFVNLSDNEIRKYVYLHDLNDFDVELKSWASEVARVFFERKYQIKMPKVLNERNASIFQTRFFGHPLLLKWSDNIYYKFLHEIGLKKPIKNYEHSDLFYWEIRMGCWGVSVISSQQLYHRVTMPMNNRKILDMFLSLPREKRKTDDIHKNIMNIMNHNVLNVNVEIANLYFRPYRIWLEKIYYYFRMVLFITKD